MPTLGVERPDHLRRGDHDQRRPEALEHHAERVAVAAPAGLHERDRPRQPARGLDRGRLGRSGGKRAHAGTAYPPSAPSSAPATDQRHVVAPRMRGDLHADRQPVQRRAAADRRRRPPAEAVRRRVAHGVHDLAVPRRRTGVDRGEQDVEAFTEAQHRLTVRVPAPQQVIADRAGAVGGPDLGRERVPGARRRGLLHVHARLPQRVARGGHDPRRRRIGRRDAVIGEHRDPQLTEVDRGELPAILDRRQDH